MPAICWGLLAKAANDTTTIEQAIETLLAEHNENVTAHGGYGYALYTHRQTIYMDHPYQSILPGNFADVARVYSAVVDPSGFGDYTDIQEAIDYVDSKGGGSIFIRAGTYNITTTLNLKSGVNLIGEKKDEVILNFIGNNRYIRLGTGFVRWTGGTVQWTNNSDQVVGTGDTYFTRISPGNWIFNLYSRAWYQVESVQDNTHLTLARTYRGRSFSSATWWASPLVQGVALKNFTIQGNGMVLTGLLIYGAQGVEISDIDYLDAGDDAFTFMNCDRVIVRNCYIESKRYGLRCEYVYNSNFEDNRITGQWYYSGAYATVYAIYLKYGYSTNISGCTCDGGLYDGIFIEGSYDCSITNCHINNNSQSGVVLDSGTYYTTVNNNQIMLNADYGVVIGAGCNYNVVNGNIIRGNGIGTISDSGSGNIKTDNA